MRRWSKECDFIQRTDWPRRWQTNVSIVLSGAGCQVLYGSEMRGGEQTELKKTFNSCKYLLERQTPDRGMCSFYFLVVILQVVWNGVSLAISIYKDATPQMWIFELCWQSVWIMPFFTKGIKNVTVLYRCEELAYLPVS